MKISASVLSADFGNLESELKKLEYFGVDYIHLDVMDGVFVPNISVGHPVVESIRGLTSIPLDVHLMIQSPSRYIRDFYELGSNMITIHLESEIHIHRVIHLIRSYGIKAGAAIVPTTHYSSLEYVIEDLDLVLVMSVNPGFGGQEFIHSQLDKIESIRNMIDSRNLKTQIYVDGGVNDKNAKQILNAGANVLVVGSFLFQSDDMEESINKLRCLY